MVKMATPKHSPNPSPARSVYGFAMYLVFRICLILYLIWAAFSDWLLCYGIRCSSHRYWYVTIPIFLITTLTVFAFLIYPGFGMIMTPEVSDYKTFRDKTSEKRKLTPNLCNIDDDLKKCCVCKDEHRCSMKSYRRDSHNNSKMSIPVVEDLQIWQVSKYLHSRN